MSNYQLSPKLCMPIHSVAGMKLHSFRRVWYDEENDKVMEEITGNATGGIVPFSINSAAEINVTHAEQLVSQLTKALDAHRIAGKLRRQSALLRAQ
ncbi:hypothetical protein [Paremcibacter congregatus]|uniref:hypothetical protein n=1 Tax=Paremcibacter congregatus TaxID=2043170 RepID=UPI0030EEF3D3|tara:strand:- start:113 stop:400 length:288 start_codon:yes stop_codon:yes gene_type:complete